MSTDGINPIQLLPPEVSAEMESAESTQQEGKVERPYTWPPVEQEQQIVQEEVESLSKEDIEKITNVLNESAKLFDISLRFSVESDINRIIVTVFDKTNDEVIRQVPPEEVVRLAKKLSEMVGVLFNKTA